ncbi:glutathione S-transferase [Rhodopseudomonas boonkerdii]|uniref:glutathione binding-like protein n=1 Tax=Rhodopseudomonas boonkerdii TaxID=475937 RepID=UPI001E61E63B|nr:glutathione binding-like protein [Rhodopseudomonas boonkerdii]UGV25495.1 glutathione S-transferase [Rhodopseudomonas boonkerdii]
MDLYFSPMACSMATRIALYEAEGEARFIEVDPPSKTLLQDGSDFHAINPLGLVPTLRTDDGVILTENAAILQYVAEHFPDSAIAAGTGMERSRLQQWLCFIGTELHKALFQPQLSKKTPAEAKAYALETGRSRLDYLENHLKGREFLLERFSVADAYLTTVLNWTTVIPQLDLHQWPAIKAYHGRMRERPSVVRAVSEEFKLFKAEQARHKAAA